MLVLAASCLLPECCGHSKFAQLDLDIHGWQDVLLESGHASSTARNAGPATTAE